jgi:hypothetical protein
MLHPIMLSQDTCYYIVLFVSSLRWPTILLTISVIVLIGSQLHVACNSHDEAERVLDFDSASQPDSVHQISLHIIRRAFASRHVDELYRNNDSHAKHSNNNCCSGDNPFIHATKVLVRLPTDDHSLLATGDSTRHVYRARRMGDIQLPSCPKGVVPRASSEEYPHLFAQSSQQSHHYITWANMLLAQRCASVH